MITWVESRRRLKRPEITASGSSFLASPACYATTRSIMHQDSPENPYRQAALHLYLYLLYQLNVRAPLSSRFPPPPIYKSPQPKTKSNKTL